MLPKLKIFIFQPFIGLLVCDLDKSPFSFSENREVSLRFPSETEFPPSVPSLHHNSPELTFEPPRPCLCSFCCQDLSTHTEHFFPAFLGPHSFLLFLHKLDFSWDLHPLPLPIIFLIRDHLSYCGCKYFFHADASKSSIQPSSLSIQSHS